VDAVQVSGPENHDVYLIFSPRFEHIWLEAKKRLPEYMADEPADIGLRSQYALRLYSWAKKYVSAGTKRISLEELRKVLGLESLKDAARNIIQEAPLPVWANLQQRALDTAIGDWIYEIKFDGYRALALRGCSKTRLLSRSEKDKFNCRDRCSRCHSRLRNCRA
jgi:hypothetical protein